MTTEDFAFWEKAFLAAMQGCLASNAEKPQGINPSWLVANCAEMIADAALAVWREKRRELHMPENGGKG